MNVFYPVAVAVGAAAFIGLTGPAVAAAAPPQRFALAVGDVSTSGSYQDIEVAPPPGGGSPSMLWLVVGTLRNDRPAASRTCGVVQLAQNTPTDTITWLTVSSLCEQGKTTFNTQYQRLRGNRIPPVRLCFGHTIHAAERAGGHCRYSHPGDSSPLGRA